MHGTSGPTLLKLKAKTVTMSGYKLQEQLSKYFVRKCHLLNDIFFKGSLIVTPLIVTPLIVIP